MALKPPVEVPQGAIRLNTDSQKLEFFAQDQWWEMSTEESTTTSQRGISGGGQHPSPSRSVTEIEYFNLASAGNASDFGDLTQSRYCREGGSGSFTRGIFGGGYSYPGANAYVNTIDYITIAQQGNAIDFGDLSSATMHPGTFSNSIRMLSACGHSSSGPTYPVTNFIDYVTIASTGNAQDFGDVVTPKMFCGTASNRTRGIWAGGSTQYIPNQGDTNVMNFVTIASTGNSLDFGDLINPQHWLGGTSNNIRAVWAGGYDTPGATDTVQLTIIPTLGNTIDFGDLSIAGLNAAYCSSPTHGYMIGGEPSRQSRIHQFSLNGSNAESVVFGDLTAVIAYNAGLSNCHGGL